jgi:hypothetical protein
MRRLLAIDSVAAPAHLPFPVQGVSLAPLLAEPAISAVATIIVRASQR